MFAVQQPRESKRKENLWSRREQSLSFSTAIIMMSFHLVRVEDNLSRLSNVRCLVACTELKEKKTNNKTGDFRRD